MALTLAPKTVQLLVFCYATGDFLIRRTKSSPIRVIYATSNGSIFPAGFTNARVRRILRSIIQICCLARPTTRFRKITFVILNDQWVIFFGVIFNVKKAALLRMFSTPRAARHDRDIAKIWNSVIILRELWRPFPYEIIGEERRSVHKLECFMLFHLIKLPGTVRDLPC